MALPTIPIVTWLLFQILDVWHIAWCLACVRSLVLREERLRRVLADDHVLLHSTIARVLLHLLLAEVILAISSSWEVAVTRLLIQHRL